MLQPVAGQRLDQQQRAVRRQRLPDTAGSPDRVTHVVQAVEQADQVVAGARQRLGGRDVEPHPPLHASLHCRLAGGIDRCSWMSKPANVDRPNACAMMIVDAPSPTSDVGDARAFAQLVDHPVQGREPFVDAMGGVAGTEQPQDAGGHPVVVVLPADPCAGTERVHEQVVVGVAGGDALEGAAEEDRPRKTGLSSSATTMACSGGSSNVLSAGLWTT